MAVRHARDEQAEVDGGRVGGQIAQRRIALQHVRLRGQARRFDLEEVVHERQPVHLRGFDGCPDPGELAGNGGRSAVDIEDGQVKTEVHW
jgi:hypothetical protein